MLKECHERMIEFVKPIDVIVGSLGVYTRDFDMIYFTEKPTFKRCKGVDIYGSNTSVYLDKIGISLQSNSRHSNGFDAYKNNSIVDMFYLMGSGYDNWIYYGPEGISQNNHNDPKLYEWVRSEWSKVCDRLKIKNYSAIRNINNPKITVPEFMVILKNNQDNY